MQIAIYRGLTANVSVKISDTSAISQKLNGEDICNLRFDSPVVVDLALGDYITIQSKRYTLNFLPTEKKSSTHRFEYDCVFESRMYELSKILYSDGIGMDFLMTGDLAFFVDLIITNLNRVQSGWAAGTVLSGTETKNLQFTNENCLEVLQRLCEEYDVEFIVNEDKSIDVGEFGETNTQTFAYGKGNGLYSLERKTVDSKNLFTRLYAFGAERNIPANYRSYSTRLKLAAGYIERNVATYGIIEAATIFEDIYPRFMGAITALGSAENIFRCSTLDFDLNSYLIGGTSAKIHFNTGALAGYEFELSAYTHSTKEFTLKYSEQEKTYSDSGLEPFILPNATIKPSIGDEFVILDITMPDSYITAAEAELLVKATDYLNQNSDPRVTYSLAIDPLFAQQIAFDAKVGDYIQIEDSDLGIDNLVRITGIRKGIYSPVTWQIDLSDHVAPQLINRVLAELEDVRRLIIVNKLSDVARAKRNWKTAVEIRNKIFDPDGYFDPVNIKPLSIETTMLSVGTRAGNLTLSSTIEPNYTRDPSQIRFGAGTLVHFQVESAIRTWTISENIVTGLVSGTTYYIYARCARVGSSAILLTDTVQRTIDSDPTYYYFPIGILSSVIDGWRDAVMTYGQSYLVGRMLNVGRITGQNGLEINLDTGEVIGQITFSDGTTEAEITSAVATAIELSDIASHYSFDETTGAKIYDNVGGKHGTTSGTRTFEDGVINKCLVTGVNNTYGFVDELAITQSFSLAFWINGQATWNVSSDIIRSAEANGFRVSAVTGTRQIIFRVRNNVGSGVESTMYTMTPADIDGWHHCALTYDGTNGSWVAYWDGAQVNAGTNYVARSASDNIDMYLGWNQGASYLISRMDELYICKTVLTAKKVKYLFLLRDALSRHSVQTVIDGGIVTTGLLQLGDGATIKAGINGGGILDDDIRLWAGDTYANRASAPFRVQQDGKVNATAGEIGGWNLDADAIYSGTKHITDNWAEDGITLASDGSIHGENIYVNADGEVGIRSQSVVMAYTGVSNTVIIAHDAEIVRLSTTYVVAKTITLGANLKEGRTLRIKFTLASSSGSVYAYGMIYRNGVAVGTERRAHTTPTEFSEDISGWSAGDALQLYAKSDSISVEAILTNFRICGTLALIVDEVTGTLT